MNLDQKNGSELSIWSIKPSKYYSTIYNLVAYLSQDELQRANKFKTRKLAQDWVITRATLRLVLGEKFNLKPSEVKFEYGEYGKPYAVTDTGRFHSFNISHTRGYAVIAQTNAQSIGVDAEYIPVDNSILSSIKMFLSVREQSLINSHPISQQKARAYQYWVCKEALVKAIGAGLQADIRRVEVHFNDSGLPYFDLSQLGITDNWFPQFISTPAGFTGALVTKAVGTNSISYKSLPAIPRHQTV